MKLFSIFILSIYVVSCAKHNISENKVVINTTNVESISLNQLISETRIIPLETNDTSLISRIKKICYWNNEYYIYDRSQKQIFVFDLRGKFIKKLNKIGRGPGEYLDISDFIINPSNNNIEIVDGYNLYVYNSSFKFIEKIIIPKDILRSINNLEIVSEDLIVFLGNGKAYLPVIYDRHKKHMVKISEIYPKWLLEKMPFNSNNKLYRNGPIINYVEGFSNKIYSVKDDGFHYKYEWDFGHYNFQYDNSSLSKLIKSSTKEDIMKNSEIFRKRYVVSFRHNIENKRFVLTSFFFKGEPTSLLYNKETKNYILFNGELSFLLFTSVIDFIGDNELIVIVDPEELKGLPIEWFSKKNIQEINAVNPLNNPVILSFYLKSNLLEN